MNDLIRCYGSATERYIDDNENDGGYWNAKITARCGVCGKRVGLYPYGSTLAREAGPPVGWRMKTHYRPRKQPAGE